MHYKSRTLLAVTGLSPQIVTETLYALLQQHGENAIPSRVKLLTTKEGANRARLTLLDKYSGKFHAFVKEFALEGKIQFTEQDIHLISTATGQPLDDIVTPEDNAVAANCITDLMRQLTQEADTQLHVSIAGGRKTMGFYLGYAFSLFARPQDVLSHVLVASPFESNPEFFYPPKNGVVLYTQDKKPIHTDDAKIWLAEIPVVKLRHGVSVQQLQKEVSYTDVVQEVEQSFAPPKIVLNIPKQTIECDGELIPLTELWFVLLAHLILSKKNGINMVVDKSFYEGLLATAKKLIPGQGEGEELISFFSPKTTPNTTKVVKTIRSVISKIKKEITKVLPISYYKYDTASKKTHPNVEFFFVHVDAEHISIIDHE